MKKVSGIIHTVFDIEKVVAFFIDVLGFQEDHRFTFTGEPWDSLFNKTNCQGIWVRLRLGEEFFSCIEFIPPQSMSYSKESKSNDKWFQHMAIATSNMEKAHAKLMEAGVESISEKYQTIPSWNSAASGIKAFYFRSYNGHPLELIFFPLGKGDPKWQKTSGLLMGIDHTAICVTSTEKSLKFYQDFLGMEMVGSSLNYGIEQEKLSGVIGAKVQISALRFPNTSGIGVEFLEYLQPLDGKSFCEETDTADLRGSFIVIEVENISSLHEKLKDFSIRPLSRKIVEITTPFGFRKAFAILDPDGHRILLVEND